MITTHPFWTDESRLRAKLDARHAPLGPPDALMQRAVRAWHDARPRTIGPLPDETFDDWQHRARRFVLEQMRWPETDAPFDVEVLSSVERDGYTERQIELTVSPPMRAPATVLVPRAGDGPFPAVIALHDMGALRTFGREKLLAFDGEPKFLTDHRDLYYSGRSVMADLARRGYVVIAIDSISFGLRTLDAARDRDGFIRDRLAMTTGQAQKHSARVSAIDEPAHVRTLMMSGRTWPGLVFHDDRRTVDYLCGRDDVDATRIGCVGLSLGGFRANYLGALDERVAAAVSVCWSTTLAGLVDYNGRGALGWFTLVPGMMGEMDLSDLQALSAPRAFMAISGWRDTLFEPYGMAQAHLNLRDAFMRAGRPEKLGSLTFDAPHEFNAQMQERAWAFFDAHLK